MADPTGSLEPGQVCPFTNGEQVSADGSVGEGAAFDALVYRPPGMSPGDIRKVQIKYTKALSEWMAAFKERASLDRVNVVFFSAKGDPRHNHRSLADMLAGGDYDGDEYQIIVWQDLVKLFVHEFPPYDKDAPLPKLQKDAPRRGGGATDGKGKGKARAAAQAAAAALQHRPPSQPQQPQQSQQWQPCNCKLCRMTKSQAETRSAEEAARAQEEVRAAYAAEQAAAKAAQNAAASARASRGKQAQLMEAEAREREAEARQREAEEAAARTKALISNFLMARFMGSPMVGSSATHWMIFVDLLANEGGCCHPICLHLAHEYLQALDAEGCERLELGFHRQLPNELRSSNFPAHMQVRPATEPWTLPWLTPPLNLSAHPSSEPLGSPLLRTVVRSRVRHAGKV